MPIAALCTPQPPGNLCLQSGSSGAWPQPSHNHVVRRSPAARQAVPLDRGFCKSQCLLAGLSFLARKCHPLANNGASCLRLGHLDFLLRLFRSPDGALRRLLDRIVLRSSRQKRATAFMHGFTRVAFAGTSERTEYLFSLPRNRSPPSRKLTRTVAMNSKN